MRFSAGAKLLSVFFVAAQLFLGFERNSFAQETGAGTSGSSGSSMVYPDILPPPDKEPGFLGQDHAYTVTFRGNGEAVVSLRVIFSNYEDGPKNALSLRIPRVDPKELAVYQMIRDRVCIRYLPQAYDPLTRSYPQICAEYQDPDYYQYYWGGTKYQKAKFSYEGDTLIVSLPQAVALGKSGSFFVYFRAFGYAKKNIFGAYAYTFESLKAEEAVRSLRVGIATDSDLVLKGVEGEVQYRFEAPQFSALEKSAGAPAANSAMDQYVSKIGQGKVTKTASNLSPLESYTATGAFAKNMLMLYGKEIAVGVGAVLAIVIILVLVLKFIFRKLRKETGTKSATGIMIAASAGVGFVSAFLIAGYTVGIFLLVNLMDSFIGYQYQTFFALFLILISFCVYLLLIFAPGIFMGIKKGAGWGIATVVLTVVWLILFLGVFILVVFLMGKSPSSPIFTPLMERSIQ